MSAWTTEELTRIDTAEEPEITTLGGDDAPGSPQRSGYSPTAATST